MIEVQDDKLKNYLYESLDVVLSDFNAQEEIFDLAVKLRNT